MSLKNSTKIRIKKYILEKLELHDASLAKKVADNFGVSLTTVYRYIHELEDEGLIVKENNKYKLLETQEIKTYHTNQASVYKGYKRDKIEMRGDRAEMSDFPLYLNTVAGGLDCRNQAIGGFSFVVKIYALPVVEIIRQFLYLLGRYGFDAQIGYCF